MKPINYYMTITSKLKNKKKKIKKIIYSKQQ